MRDMKIIHAILLVLLVVCLGVALTSQTAVHHGVSQLMIRDNINAINDLYVMKA